MRDLPLIVTRGQVQAHARFAGPGHARHKHDRLPPPLAGFGDDPLHRGARDREVHGPRVAAGDVVHRVAGVERPGRLDDRGRGGRGAAGPCGWRDGKKVTVTIFTLGTTTPIRLVKMVTVTFLLGDLGESGA
jgi:hypothetical protein